MTCPEHAHQLGPSLSPDRLRVPGVEADRACEVDAVEAGDQLPKVHRIEVRIRVVEVHPGVEPDSHPAAVGDDLARPRPSHRGRRNTGGERRLLERRALEQFGDVLVGGIADLFDRPAPALGIQPPDRAEPPAGDGAVRQPSPRPEVERREDGRKMTVVERDQLVISAVTVRTARPRMWLAMLNPRNAGLASAGTPMLSTSSAWTTKK